MNKISLFKGKYYFLSNFFIVNVPYNGLVFTNSEAAFQSAKCINYEDRKKFIDLNPSDAKKIGRKVSLRYDWEKVKYQIMHDVVYNKFYYNKDLTKLLLDTGNTYLEEDNTWHDTEWGVCNGIGKNYLGKILMQVREELKNIK